MSKAVPTRQQLEDAVPLIYHEMGQLFAYWVWWTQVRPVLLPRLPEKSIEYGMIQNSAVVASLLALRKLNEFFKDCPKDNNEHDDDLRAYDYPGFGNTGALIHPDDFSELHKRIGHMTYREVDCGKASYELYEAVGRVLPRCIEFLGYLGNTFYSGQEDRREDIEKVQKGLLAFRLRWEEENRVASEPAATQLGKSAVELRRPVRWDIGWPSAIFFGILIWVVYLLAVDPHFSESIKEGPAVMLGHSVVGLVILPIGAILATPIWFFAWLFKGRERVSFKVCFVSGMGVFLVLCFIGRQYAETKLVDKSRTDEGRTKLSFEDSPEHGGDSRSLQFQARSAGDKLSPPRKAELDATDLASLELLDGGLNYVYASNSLVEEYRRKVPNDPRSDDELTRLFGEAHDKDNRYSGYPDFVAHYQMLKKPDFQAYNTVQGRIRNKASRALHAATLECTIYNSDKNRIETRLVALTNLSVTPGTDMRFSEKLDLLTPPRGFTWSCRFTGATFY